MNMPVSKRKCDFDWTYVDEVTGKAHKIVVYRLLDGEHVTHLAEARTPIQISDKDENPNVLRQRMIAQLAAGRTIEPEQRYLLTASSEDFGGDPLDFKAGKRNHVSVSLRWETFETFVIPDEEGKEIRMWRGVAGKSYRFSGPAKPGLPPTGRVDRDDMTRSFDNTDEDRAMLRYIRGLFLEVAQAVRVLASPSKATEVAKLLAGYMAGATEAAENGSDYADTGVWAALCKLGARNGNGHNGSEAVCPRNDQKSSTGVTPANAGVEPA
jgi:hypothetical protein